MCKIEQLKSTGKIKKTKNYIGKDIVVSNPIELGSEITYSSNKINEGNTYNNSNILDKGKTNEKV